MDLILKRLNQMGWYLMLSWQNPDRSLCMVARRTKEPQFVVSSRGDEEGRMLGDLEVKAAWLEKFIEENSLEAKFDEFVRKKEESIRFIQENKCK